MTNRTLPSGTRDEFGVRTQQKELVLNQMQAEFRARGLQKITTPLIEYQEVFAPMDRNLYQQYQMLDERGATLVLRPDLTLPIARVMSTTGIEPPVKWYYNGDVFRVSRRLAGDYDQVTQAGMEIIGYSALTAEWECLDAACTIAAILELAPLTIELGNAQFADAVLDALDLDTSLRTELASALFGKNLTRFAELLAQLPATELTATLADWPWLFGDARTVLTSIAPLAGIAALTPIISQLTATVDFLQATFKDVQVTIDLSTPAPQNYYTGITFRGYGANGRDYLFSGGRYDQLLASFQNTALPAVGLSFDVDAVVRMQPAMNEEPVKQLIYFSRAQWQAARTWQKQHPGSVLCLAKTLRQAQSIAKQQGLTLIDLTKEVRA